MGFKYRIDSENRSLGSAEGSASLEVVSDISVLARGVEGVVVGGACLTLNLHINVGEVLDGERLSFGSIECGLTGLRSVVEALGHGLGLLGLATVVEVGQESVIFLVGGELERVLIVLEESSMPVGQVSEVASLNIRSDLLKV